MATAAGGSHKAVTDAAAPYVGYVIVLRSGPIGAPTGPDGP